MQLQTITQCASTLALLLSMGCQGDMEVYDLHESQGDVTAGEDEATPPIDREDPVVVADMAPDTEPPEEEVLPGGPLPLRVLNRTEYIYTIEDVLGVDASSVTEGFPSEIDGDTGLPTVGSLSSLHVQRYQDAAEAIALSALEAAKGAVTECATMVDDACAQALVDHVGPQLFRRPLLELEREEYAALWAKAQGQELGLMPDAALTLLLSAMLQSPFFLYRWERSDTWQQTTDSPVEIAPWQLASRLSYFLWQAPPDEELRQAAASGALLDPEELERQARRMVSHERARRALPGLFSLFFDLPKILEMPKHAGLFPHLNEGMREGMLTSSLLFFEAMIFEPTGSYKEMLTSPVAFVNRHVAPLYGLDPEVFEDEWERRELDPSRRAGLITLPAMLAVHADAAEGNPIFRGVSFQEQVLCRHIPPPNGDVPPLPPMGEGGDTLRERVTFHTAPTACAGCHALINPPGFAFGHYDAIGRWQDTEGEHAIDASSEMELLDPTEVIAFDGAAQLAQAVAEHPAPYRCLTDRLSRYAYGRELGAGDLESVREAQAAFEQSGWSVQELLVAIATSPSFRLVLDSDPTE